MNLVLTRKWRGGQGRRGEGKGGGKRKSGKERAFDHCVVQDSGSAVLHLFVPCPRCLKLLASLSHCFSLHDSVWSVNLYVLFYGIDCW